MAHYKASESKREQFRRYLEKSGVLDTITSVLVALYEETDKPNNALELIQLLETILARMSHSQEIRKIVLRNMDNHWRGFIKLHLGTAGPEPADAEALRMELADLQQKCNLLMEENKELKNRLMQYEPSPENGAAE